MLPTNSLARRQTRAPHRPVCSGGAVPEVDPLETTCHGTAVEGVGVLEANLHEDIQ